MTLAGTDVDKWLSQQPDDVIKDSADAYFWYENALIEGEEPLEFGAFADKVDAEKERRLGG